jgi:predicted dithiol-disulfide oxidoreductase (DUF899 family)
MSVCLIDFRSLFDNFAGSILHLAARDTSFAAISRAPLAKIESFKKRMGWSFPWLSSFGSDFNYDFHVTLDQATGLAHRIGPLSNLAFGERLSTIHNLPPRLRGEL